jgi:hypothetical protein
MSEITRRTFFATTASLPLFAQQSIPNRRLLSGRVTAEALQQKLQSRAQWRPYAPASDRGAWEALPADVKERVMKAGEGVLGKPYEPLPASLFLEFARNGNRSRYEAVRSRRREHLQAAVLAACVEGKGRFLDDIADGIWTTCEESFWGVPAHMGAQKRGVGLPDVQEPIIDLFAAETAAELAWSHYLVGPSLDKVHPLVRQRLEAEIERRVLSVYRERSDFGWMGLNNSNPVNNWNPWINSNVLTCALLLDSDAARRARTVHKILTSLDRFLDSYHDDGGCDEGPGYWNRAGASLFECLDLVQSATGGGVNYFDLPLVRQIGAYIYRVHIAGDWFVNFADAPAKVHPDGSLMYRFGAATGDADLQAFGAHALQAHEIGMESLGRALPAVFGCAAMRKAEARQPLAREAWMPGIQVAAARSRQGSTDGFYFAALGGHNAESHNHNDVGSLVIFLDGNPVLIDVGVETYTAKTFSSKRYEIWTMQSAYHNLPTINGVMQAAGRQYAARDVSFTSDETAAEFVADIAAAYPKEAGVDKWLRSIRLDRGANRIVVTDRFALRAASGKVEMSLMTAAETRATGPRTLSIGGRVRLEVEGPGDPQFRVEEVATTDSRLRGVWGPKVYRTLVSWSNLPASGELKFGLQ